MGEIAYNFLSLQACQTSSQHFSDFLGYSPSPEDTYDATCPFSPVSGSTGYTSSPDNMQVLNLIHSKKLSKTSS